MKSLGRFGLFIVVNIAFMLTISFILSLLGVNGYYRAGRLDYQALMVFCLCWGMVGSFLSLAMSRVMAKWLQGVQVLNPHNAGELQWLVNMVHQQAKQAGISKMPEVGVYDSPVVNAFATGPTKNRALVAFSSGILQQMSRDELEGVSAHEISHIQNGDMVTMTLIQGIVNAFVMFISRVIASVVADRVNENSRHMVRFFVTIVLEIVVGALGMIVTCWFSRHREFRADAGSARIAGREKMIAALESLKRMQGYAKEYQQAEPQSMAALKISGPKGHSLFATHPDLDARIAALRNFAG